MTVGELATERAGLSPIAWARWIVGHPADRVFFVDTETTGIGSDDVVVTVGVIGLAGVRMSFGCRPSKAMTREVIDIHGITNEAVAGLRPWPEVEAIIAAIINPMVGFVTDKPIVVAYNAEYDMRLLNQSNAAHGIERRYTGWHCAMQRYAALVGEPSRHPRGGFKWHKLGDAAHRYGLKVRAHNAVGDATTTRDLVLAMAAMDGESA